MKLIQLPQGSHWGAVYKVRQLSLDRLVAIKVLPKKFTHDPEFVKRLYDEGQATANLSHPNIVGALDVGLSGDHHYFVMEYVEGKPWVRFSLTVDTRKNNRWPSPFHLPERYATPMRRVSSTVMSSPTTSRSRRKAPRN